MLEEVQLPEIVAGNDIIGSRIYGNKVLIYSNSDYYIYDIKEEILSYEQYKLKSSPDEYPYFSRICTNESGFGYLIQNENNVVFRYYPVE